MGGLTTIYDECMYSCLSVLFMSCDIAERIRLICFIAKKRGFTIRENELDFELKAIGHCLFLPVLLFLMLLLFLLFVYSSCPPVLS